MFTYGNLGRGLREESSTRIHISKEDIGDGITILLSRHEPNEDRGDGRGPGHEDRSRGMDHDNGLVLGSSDGSNEGVLGGREREIRAVHALGGGGSDKDYRDVRGRGELHGIREGGGRRTRL
jgi:hypothetical protein